MMSNRFDRNERLFGKDGQEKIRDTKIAIMGAGGIGSHVVNQAALLGVGDVAVVDREELTLSNRNRYVGVWHTDLIPGTPKVVLAQRQFGLIDPSINVTAINDDIASEAGLEALKRSKYVVGCVDNDGVRFFLNEACLAHNKQLIDLASDVPASGVFGGHVALIGGTHGCLHCLDMLDPDEVRRFLASTEMLENEASVYGISVDALSGTGPSVVSINGVVASLGVTALMCMITGMRLPYTLQNYRGDWGTVSRQTTTGRPDCFYCSTVQGMGDQANLERYFSATKRDEAA